MVADFYDALPADYLDPGQTMTVEVDGFPVAVANVDGEYCAFRNLCPHQGSTLGGRSLEEGFFVSCPSPDRPPSPDATDPQGTQTAL